MTRDCDMGDIAEEALICNQEPIGNQTRRIPISQTKRIATPAFRRNSKFSSVPSVEFEHERWRFAETVTMTPVAIEGS